MSESSSNNSSLVVLVGGVAVVAAALVGWQIVGAEGPTNDGPEEAASSETGADAEPSSEGRESEQADDHQSDNEMAAIPGGTEPRTFEFRYEMTLQPGDGSDVDVFIPLASDTPHQKILNRTIEAPVEGEIRKEDTYGNEFWHANLDELPDEPQTFRVTYQLRREVFQRENLDEKAGGQYPEDIREKYDLFLGPNEKVPTSGKLIDQVVADSEVDDDPTPLAKARTIYDFVIDKMDYKKVGSGWGNGDTYWACSEEYGNCTDYHALYTSMARNQGVPARFEIGFPVPTDRAEGEIGGYHCWLQFYLPEVGWTPIDVSEAEKNPDLKEMYFGTHPANRVRLTVGRDLDLGEGHETDALNYFIYPHVEVGGERYDEVDTTFSYSDIDA